jgi:large-conductance mechanosensitive channel
MDFGVTDVYNEFRTFVWQNNILASTAGFSIGIATKELIEKFVNRTITPNLKEGVNRAFNYSRLPKWQKNTLRVVGDILLWITIVIITFLIAEYLFKRYIFPKQQPRLENVEKNAPIDK